MITALQQQYSPLSWLYHQINYLVEYDYYYEIIMITRIIMINIITIVSTFLYYDCCGIIPIIFFNFFRYAIAIAIVYYYCLWCCYHIMLLVSWTEWQKKNGILDPTAAAPAPPAAAPNTIPAGPVIVSIHTYRQLT